MRTDLFSHLTKLGIAEGRKSPGTYYVPGFLNYLVESRIPDVEFYRSYARSDTPAVTTPLWWKRDVTVNLTGRERARELKRQLALNRYIKRQTELLEKQNASYEEKLRRDEEEFASRLNRNGELLNAKIEEMELVAKENELNLEREKLSAEAKLREEELAKEEAELLLKNEEQLRKRQLILMHKQSELRGEVDKTTAAIIKENQEKEEIRRKYRELHGENKARAATDARLPSVAPEINFVGERNVAVREKVYEAYDPANVLEVKDVYYKRESEVGFYLGGISFNVKRGKITVLYAENSEKLTHLYDILDENIPMDMVVARGIVRIEGNELVPRREDAESRVCFLKDTLSELKKGRTLRGLCEDSAVEPYLAAFGLGLRKLPKKLTTLADDLLAAVAVCATLASNKELVVLADTETLLSPGNKAILYDLLSRGEVKRTVLLTTSFPLTVREILNARVFRI